MRENNNMIMKQVQGLWLLWLLVVCTTQTLQAGPVPGVASYDKQPVEFPTPEHLDVWSIGNDEFLVTFHWKPGRSVNSPCVVGTFNNWMRDDLPMEGPDEQGNYSVTALLPGGEHQYKFAAGESEWYGDPLNQDVVSGGGGDPNAILRLGVAAVLHYLNPRQGDGVIEEQGFKHHPEEWSYFDLIATDEAILRLRTLAHDVEGVDIVLLRNGEEIPFAMKEAGGDAVFTYWEKRIKNLTGQEQYRFVAHDGNATSTFDNTFDLTIDPDRIFDTPEWASDAIWYQIMIDRFRDGDPQNNPEYTKDASTQRIDRTHPWTSSWYKEQPWERDQPGESFWHWGMYERLYGGDFQGVIDKLDYIASLGVNAIYFNPIFESTNSHKYNSRSYVFADDGYGVPGEFDRSCKTATMDDPSSWIFNESDRKFLELIEEAHQRGIKVIIDGVFNHLGDDAIVFQDVAEKKQDSAFADWYEINSWDPFEYTGWAGFSGLPQFRKDAAKGFASDSLTEHIMAVTRRWMDPNGDGDPSDGIDGWRLDVPMDVPKPFWVAWRKEVKSINPEAYITGEIWDPAEYWLDGTTFDAVMNYQFAKIAFRFFGNKEQKISASQFDRELARLRLRYPRAATYVLQNLFDSHDTDRWVSRLANPDHKYDEHNRIQDNSAGFRDDRPDEVYYQRLKLMAVFQATYIGAPMIWYGTEVGMFGADDPMSRMPMWWEDLGPFENESYIIREDLRAMFRTLFTLRGETPSLRRGEYQTVYTNDGTDSIGYLRYGEQGPSVLVMLNNSDAEQEYRVAIPYSTGLNLSQLNVKMTYCSAHSGASVKHEGKGSLSINLPAISGAIISFEEIP